LILYNLSMAQTKHFIPTDFKVPDKLDQTRLAISESCLSRKRYQLDRLGIIGVI